MKTILQKPVKRHSQIVLVQLPWYADYFREPVDRIVFQALLSQYVRLQMLLLGPSCHGSVTILYCRYEAKNLWLFLQRIDNDQTAEAVLHAVTTSYARYFQKKYQQPNRAFIDVYTATNIIQDERLAIIKACFRRPGATPLWLEFGSLESIEWPRKHKN